MRHYSPRVRLGCSTVMGLPPAAADVAVASATVGTNTTTSAALNCNQQLSPLACQAQGSCIWLPVNGSFTPPGLVELVRLTALQFPSAFNPLSLAPCASFSPANPTCPSGCSSFLGQLSVSTVSSAAGVVCALKTCGATADRCYETADDWTIKRFIFSIVQACLPPATASVIPSCWPANGTCVPGAAPPSSPTPMPSSPTPTSDRTSSPGSPSLTVSSPAPVPGSTTKNSAATAPVPTPSTPGAGACPANATSFSDCVLGAGNCSWSAYCTVDTTNQQACYMLTSQDGCLAAPGCSWMPFQTSPQPGYNGTDGGGTVSSGNTSQYPPYSPMPPPSNAPYWPVSPAPGPQPEQGANLGPSNTSNWWEVPNHHGHGPFDVLTPPVALALIELNAAPLICDTLADTLAALRDGGFSGSPCERAGLCDLTNPSLPLLQQLLAAILPPQLAGITPCFGCKFALEGELGAWCRGASCGPPAAACWLCCAAVGHHSACLSLPDLLLP